MINQTFIMVVLASSLACGVTMAGICGISECEAWGRWFTSVFPTCCPSWRNRTGGYA
jgi:hypothetical protein